MRRGFGQLCLCRLVVQPPSPGPRSGGGAWLCGRRGALAASSNKDPRPRAGLPPRQPNSVRARWGGETRRRQTHRDDFIFFKGDSQFVQFLITWAPELEFQDWEDKSALCRAGWRCANPYLSSQSWNFCLSQEPPPAVLAWEVLHTLHSEPGDERILLCAGYRRGLELLIVTNSFSRSWSSHALSTAVYYSTLCWQPAQTWDV